MTGRRVVVTGVGAVTPSGTTAADLWAAVRDGRSGITALSPEITGGGAAVGGQVRGFAPPSDLPPPLRRHLPPAQLWAVAAADEAVGDSPGIDADIIVATGSGPVDLLLHAENERRERGRRRVPPSLPVHGTADAVATVIGRRHGLRGQAQSIAAACASGAVAIGEGLRRIRHGYADAVLVVGMEDLLGPLHLAANANLGALATGFADDPASASRPFDRARSGYVMSHGAAAVLLESESAAAARGARPIAAVIGFGATSDAGHATAPDASGAGAAAAISSCLADAGATIEVVDHVNAHGTGTVLGDEAELVTLERAFGPRIAGIPLTATKSSTGHLLGAAGVVETVIAALTLRDQVLPPTINLDDPVRDWDFVRDRARQHPVSAVLSTSFGFGGRNAALLIERV